MEPSLRRLSRRRPPNPIEDRKSMTDQLKELIRAHGKDPDQILTREALVENAATVVDQEDYQLQTPRRMYRILVRQEIVQAVQG